jgi:hypothetical protein
MSEIEQCRNATLEEGEWMGSEAVSGLFDMIFLPKSSAKRFFLVVDPCIGLCATVTWTNTLEMLLRIRIAEDQALLVICFSHSTYHTNRALMSPLILLGSGYYRVEASQ